MRIIIGLVVVTVCVLGGFVAMGGHLSLLAQPFEFVIILGGAAGAYIIANNGPVLKQTPKDVIHALKGSKSNPERSLELMACLYGILKKMKSQGGDYGNAGASAIETDLQDPYNSKLFTDYPSVVKNPRAVTFITDFFKLLTHGNVDAHQLEELLDEEIETIREDYNRVPEAIGEAADGLPAFGIVAAVMGVIKTMASIDKSPEVIGGMIGGALVGTFAGILFAYSVFKPLAHAVQTMHEEDVKYFEGIKTAILSTYKGNDPVVSVEFARRILFTESRPKFEDVEERVQQAKAA